MGIVRDDAVVAGLVDSVRNNNWALVLPAGAHGLLLRSFHSVHRVAHVPLGLLIIVASTHLIACHSYEALALLGGCRLTFCSIKSILGKVDVQKSFASGSMFDLPLIIGVTTAWLLDGAALALLI